VAELGEDPVVTKLLDGKTPEMAAAMYVKSSKLRDVSERKRLNEEDGMIRFVRILDEPGRTLRKRYEDRVEAALTSSAALIAQARFATSGTSTYPDATFTFRIAYGAVKGYVLNGEKIPYATTFEGLYRRATGMEPFRLPASWTKAKSAVRLPTPFNFVTTADTHGGNSGSPTIDTHGEVIGIAFDGNMESLPNRFVYTDRVARSVHVASQGIVESLRSVYHADSLLKELRMQ
jgi:hypothetical protein